MWPRIYVSFADPLVTELISLLLQHDEPDEPSLLPWATVDEQELHDHDVGENYTFGPRCTATWALISEQLTLCEKYWGKATLVHNLQAQNALSDWNLGIIKVLSFMAPPSSRRKFFVLVKCHAQSKLAFLETALTEAYLCFTAKQWPDVLNLSKTEPRSPSSATVWLCWRIQRIFDSVVRSPATDTEINVALTDQPAQFDFQRVAPRARKDPVTPLPHTAAAPLEPTNSAHQPAKPSRPTISKHPTGTNHKALSLPIWTYVSS